MKRASPYARDAMATQVWRIGAPREVLGTVIGKSGAAIRRMELEAGCGMTIRTLPSGRQETVVTLTGTLEPCRVGAVMVARKVAAVRVFPACASLGRAQRRLTACTPVGGTVGSVVASGPLLP